MGIGHQYAFGTGTPLAGDNFFTRQLMKHFAPATSAIGLHWYPYQTNVFPPIIDTQLKRNANNNDSHIVVYLPFESHQQVCAVLNQCPEQIFILYVPNVIESKVRNVHIKTTSYFSFKQDLTMASGVICNSGFELISECLHLGLPILTRPLNGQMEQHSNALALRELNYATVTDCFTSDLIQQWLMDKKSNTPKPLPNVAKSIAYLIKQKQWHNVEQLQKTLWNETLLDIPSNENNESVLN